MNTLSIIEEKLGQLYDYQREKEERGKSIVNIGYYIEMYEKRRRVLYDLLSKVEKDTKDTTVNTSYKTT
jgi:hypothetical protein